MFPKLMKIPEKAIRVFPDRLGNLVGGHQILDSGEELDILHHHPGSTVEDHSRSSIDDAENWVMPKHHKDSSPPPSVSEAIAADEKRSDLEYELTSKEINLEKLQRIAMTGLPNGGSLRATTWKLLLGYLPSSRDLWEKELNDNRLKYSNLKEEFLSSPAEFSSRNGKDDHGGVFDGALLRQDVSRHDHPLNLGKTSAWNKYFQFTEIADQIDRDLQRTHPDIKFFSGDTKEAMRNILLLFAKINPAIRYVQGMNEVLAPLFYVFSFDSDEQNAANAEADSFCCFVRLMSDSVDHFCEHFDNSSVGIHSTLARMSKLLEEHDKELWTHLEFTTKVKTQFYGFRWITLLLTQEFDFYSILRIWDTLLSNPYGVQEMLLRVCCAMLLCVKERLMRGDFMDNMKLLQHYPDINMELLLQVAMDISPDVSSTAPEKSQLCQTSIVYCKQKKQQTGIDEHLNIQELGDNATFD